MNEEDYPIGFGLSLAMNARAMEHFTAMTEEERQTVIDRTHQVRSKKEMQALIQSIADSGQNVVG